MAILAPVSENYEFVLLIAGIAAFSWAYDRFVHKAKEESKFLAIISGVAAVIIFAELFLMVFNKEAFHWSTFLLYFALAAFMLAKPLKDFPFALSLTLVLISLLMMIYLFLREQYTLLRVIPLYSVMIVIFVIAAIFFAATMLAEKIADIFLGILSWSPIIIVLSLVAILQILLIIITGDDRGIAQYLT